MCAGKGVAGTKSCVCVCVCAASCFLACGVSGVLFLILVVSVLLDAENYGLEIVCVKVPK